MTEADRYFAFEQPPEGSAVAAGRYVDLAAVAPVHFLPGLEFRAVPGERALVSFVRYEPGTDVPRHAHAEEQFSFVLEGEFEFEVGGETRRVGPGTVIHIPPHVPHSARTHETGCYQVDVFSPPRRALLETMAAAAGEAADRTRSAS